MLRTIWYFCIFLTMCYRFVGPIVYMFECHELSNFGFEGYD
jgi:hypothetical protein